jgi:hypothetical protein
MNIYKIEFKCILVPFIDCDEYKIDVFIKLPYFTLIFIFFKNKVIFTLINSNNFTLSIQNVTNTQP